MQSGISVKPGEKLCPTCRKRCEDGELPDSHDEDFVPPDIHRETLDTRLIELGCSPLKTHGIGDKT